MPDAEMPLGTWLIFLAIRPMRHVQLPLQPSAWACLQIAMARE